MELVARRALRVRERLYVVSARATCEDNVSKFFRLCKGSPRLAEATADTVSHARSERDRYILDMHMGGRRARIELRSVWVVYRNPT